MTPDHPRLDVFLTPVADGDVARTVASLAPLVDAGVKVTLVCVGDVPAGAVAAGAEHGVGLRLAHGAWSGVWSVFDTPVETSSPVFCVIECGAVFVWPQAVTAQDIAAATLHFSVTADRGRMERGYWAGGVAAPVDLGMPLSTPLWHVRLCERARVILTAMHGADLAALERFGVDPWQAYLAANQDRLTSHHRLLPA